MSTSPTSRVRTTSPRATSPPVNRTVSPLLFSVTAAGETRDARQPSISFFAHNTAGLSKGSPKRGPPRRRLSSPPPPPVFQPRVSFDTFDRPADFIEENSFTLVTKHKDYEYTKRSRTFLCGFDDNNYSDYALQWLIDELVDDGDEIVCLRVVERDDSIAGDRSVEKGRYRDEAEGLMKKIQDMNQENKAINLILEFSIGKVYKVIDEMINLYEPAILVVGTRGRSLGGFQGLLPGSVSKYCLQHSPVPVIVVRPSSKREKARKKRALESSSNAYKDLLDKSTPLIDPAGPGTSVDGQGAQRHFSVDSAQASEDEAAAVAAAIGYRPAIAGSPLVQAHSVGGFVPGHGSGSGSFSGQGGTGKPRSRRGTGLSNVSDIDDLRSPGVIMKSPELQNLDSPDVSEDEESSSDEEGGVATEEAASPVEVGRSAEAIASARRQSAAGLRTGTGIATEGQVGEAARTHHGGAGGQGVTHQDGKDTAKS